jgi:hypothetical protein
MICGGVEKSRLLTKITSAGYPEVVADSMISEIRQKLAAQMSEDRLSRLFGLFIAIGLISLSTIAAGVLGVAVAPAIGETPNSLAVKAMLAVSIIGMVLARRALFASITGRDHHPPEHDW